jgi:hypothetical protein
MATCKFNVGDKVIGNHPTRYGMTKLGWKGVVVKVDKDGYITVKGEGNPTWNQEFDGLEPKYFDLVTPKYKVGDRVIVEESNVDEIFGSHCGKHGKIVSIWEGKSHPYNVAIDNDATLWCKVKCLESDNEAVEKIVITHDGKTTTATLYREDGSKETATARCAPEDTFDFNVGAKIAMERLTEKLTPKWKFETGDKAKIVKNTSCHGFAIGTIVELKRDEDDGWYRVSDNTPHGYLFVHDEELEAYTPPKGYNGKVVCVETGVNDHLYTVGKVYQFKDGTITCDDGNVLRRNNPVYSFRDWTDFTSSKFVEIVE